jgi:hypothetical protein
MNGFIEMALTAIYGGGDLSALRGRRAGGCCHQKSGEGCLQEVHEHLFRKV